MSLTKHTIRALAASVVFVVAGATVASAAVFHLPILGFGRNGVAAATVAPPTPSSVVHKVKPRVIVKTRYVTDVVHRPAPTAVVPRRWVAARARSHTTAPGALPAVTVAPTPVVTAPAPVPVPRPATTPTTARGDDGEQRSGGSEAGGDG